MPKLRHADTPLARFISNELGMNQTQFARAVGRHVTTVNRWLSGAIEGMDVAVAALILVSRRLPEEGKAAVWAELRNVPDESVALARLLMAMDLIPRSQGAAVRAAIASETLRSALKQELEAGSSGGMCDS